MGCCSYRIYSLVVGFIEITCSIIIIISSVIMMCILDFKPQDDVKENMTISIVSSKTNVTADNETMATTTAMPIVEDVMDEMSILITNFILCVIGLILSSLLVVGILKERPNLMRPYVYVSFVVMGLLVVVTILDSIYITANQSAIEIAVGIFVRILVTVLSILFYVPTIILYRRMRDSSDQSEQLSLRNNAAANQTSYVRGGDV